MFSTHPPDLPSGAPVVGGGRYRLVSKLGEGGMAAVYRAWDHRLGRWRAIKVLLPEYARRPRLRARFENEAALMARIDHPNVVGVDDVVTDEALPYIVMELADGGSLADWSELYGPMPPRLAVEATLQVCEGVGAAHAIGVIHRDLKPHNVIVTARGMCRVTDFGIAQVAGTDLTKTGSVLGTLGYMAPEQRADARAVDARADVYAIGATLYALLTHRIVPDLFLCERDPGLLEGVPEPLRPVVRRCVAYAPDDRWPDVHALVEALRDARERLAPDPVDTPGLPVPPEGRLVPPMGDTGPSRPGQAPGFAEIAPLITGTTPPPAPRVLPYVMPERDTTPSTGRPSWLADEPATPRPPGPRAPTPASGMRTITPRPVHGRTPAPATPSPARSVTITPAPAHRAPSRTATPAPSAREDEAGSLDAAETAADLFSTVVLGILRIVAKPLAALAVPVLGLSAVFALTFGSAALQVRAAESRAVQLREALYDALDEEQRLVDDLVALGASRSTLEALQADYRARAEEPERYDGALRLVTLLDQETRRWSHRAAVDPAGRAESARQRVERLRASLGAYEAALQEWEEATKDDRAAMAIRLGCARAP